jgi:hypothetical protein
MKYGYQWMIAMVLLTQAGSVLATAPADQMPDVLKMSADQRANYLKEVAAMRSAQIDALMAAVKGGIGDEAKRPAVVDAVRLLGDLRAENSVPVLVENITFGRLHPLAGGAASSPDDYPPVLALTLIGKPATKALVPRLFSEDDMLRRWLMCKVIYDVEGETTGKFILEEALSKAVNPKEKEHLERSLKYFQPDVGRLRFVKPQ